MAEVIPFTCWLPRQDIAAEVAAAPYDTFTRAEASTEVAAHPLSFLRIDKPAALFGEEVDEYDSRVYTRAREELETWYEQGILIPSGEPLEPAYFLYRLTRGSHVQTGVAACVSVADYQSGVIKRHENTRLEKEQDRVKHIQALEAHTGPALLAYPSQPKLDAVLKEYASTASPLFDFVASDGVQHEFWRVDDVDITEYLRNAFSGIPTLYIADGHHRAAAAVRVSEQFHAASANEGVQHAKSALQSTESTTQDSKVDYFLAVLFGSDELEVLDYNRVVSDLAGSEPKDLLASVAEVMDVQYIGEEPHRPAQRGEFGMYLDGSWYALNLRKGERPDDVVEGLDVALLHSKILEPILDISDPRADPRISYVGGIRGLGELAKRADKSGGVAFALYPCSLEELFAVADDNKMMPPKSTWFEPKLRSGLTIHRYGDHKE